MATILWRHLTCDGYNVRCELADGRKQTFHFAGGEPADAQAAVDMAEASLPVEEEEEFEIIPEVD